MELLLANAWLSCVSHIASENVGSIVLLTGRCASLMSDSKKKAMGIPHAACGHRGHSLWVEVPP